MIPLVTNTTTHIPAALQIWSGSRVYLDGQAEVWTVEWSDHGGRSAGIRNESGVTLLGVAWDRLWTTNRCTGCGVAFKGERGLRSHQSVRFNTLACKPLNRS